MESITWRWGTGQFGKLAHAGLEGQEETLCDAPAGIPILHGPFYTHRCPKCEHLRAGRMEVFPNPYAAMNRQLRARAVQNGEEF